MTRRLSRTATRVVAAIAAWHVLAFAYLATSVILDGHLPPPYFHVADDIFMDFFHTTYWAGHDGKYTEWRSIYPIFVFLLAHLTTPSECYLFDARFARDSCDNISLYVMYGISLIAAFQNARLFSSDRFTQVLCFIAISLSFPFLFGFERGNYVMYAYAFLVLAVSAKSKIAEGILLACTINLKQYLVVVLAYPLLRRDYPMLISCVISTVIVTAAGVLYLSEPNFLLFVENMLVFAETDVIGDIARLPYSASVDAFISFTKTASGAFFLDLLDFAYPFVAIEHLVLLARALEVVVLGAIAVVVLRLIQRHAELGRDYVCYLSLICLFNMYDAPALYALIFLLPYLPSVYPHLSRLEVVALFLLFQPVDFVYLPIWDYVGESYLTGEVVRREFGLMYGSTFRPAAMLFLLLFAMLRLLRRPMPPADARNGARAEALPQAPVSQGT